MTDLALTVHLICCLVAVWAAPARPGQMGGCGLTARACDSDALRVWGYRVIGVAIAVLFACAPAAWANAAPVCHDLSATVQSGQSVTVRADCADPDGDAVYPALGSDVAHGRLSMIPGGWTYTPAPGYSGPDSFQYVGTDRPPPGPFGAGDVSNVATVTLQVTPAPAAPPLPDRDGDGIPDRSDDCPSVAGTEDYDGCPPDQDGDDVPDTTDKCPTRDARIEGHDGCPAPWLPALHVAAVRTAHAIDRALGDPQRRSAFRRDLMLTIRLKLPAGLPHRRFFTVAILPVNVPWTSETDGRARCVPGRRCAVTIHTTRFQVRQLHRRSLDVRCSVSMWTPGHAADAEQARVRRP